MVTLFKRSLGRKVLMRETPNKEKQIADVKDQTLRSRVDRSRFSLAMVRKKWYCGFKGI
jgi:hypothetical protein